MTLSAWMVRRAAHQHARHIQTASVGVRWKHARWYSASVADEPSTSADEAGNPQALRTRDDIDAFLAKPSWSVSSLLPPKDQTNTPPPITSKQLRHLLQLSALPPPATPEEEKSMMDTLAAQLHFVKEMQRVDTTGIEPLRVIRDETLEAEKEQEITLDTLKDALAQEQVVGKFYKRIRRQPATTKPQRQPANWDPLSHAQRTSGKFFVVDSGKGNGD